MNRRPLVVFVCCWLTGASVPSLWQGTAQAVALTGLLLILLGCLISGSLGVLLSAVCAAALLLGCAERIAVDYGSRSDLSVLWERSGAGVPDTAEVSGFLAAPADVDGDTVTFQLDANEIRQGISAHTTGIRETVLVRVKLQQQQEQAVAAHWKRGDAVRIAGTPEKPADAGNFGAFDYRAYLERQGIRWQWSVHGAEGVRRAEGSIPLRMLPLRWIDAFRSGLGALMDRLYPHGDAGYMKGLVAGISTEVDPGQFDAFSRLGLTHVLAISGLHVGVVVFVLLRLGALMRLTRERAIDLAFAAMPLYMLVTGASPSAVRACLTAMIALALARRQRLKDGLHLLAAAAWLMTVWDPRVVENVSFQLSFAVTAGLLLFTPSVAQLFHWIRNKTLRDALAVGVTAQAVSFPLTVYYFHGFHLLSLPANLLLVPFISFAVMPLGMASVVLGGLWQPLGTFPAILASYGNKLTFGLVDWMGGAARLQTVWPQTSGLWVAAAYALLAGSFWMLKNRLQRRMEISLEEDDEEATAPLIPRPEVTRRRGPAWVGGASLIVLLWGGWLLWGYRPAFLSHEASVQFIDVGQGDGILIRTGTGKHVLVDSGGTVVFRKPGDEWRQRRNPYEIGRKLLVPLLRQRGIRVLDAFVLTHLDADHIGGAEAVIRNVPVKALICNGTWKDNAQVARLFRLATERGVLVYAANSGMVWSVDESARLQVLFPGGSGVAQHPEKAVHTALFPVLAIQNDRSVVLLVTLYGRRFLLPGDIETPSELGIVAAGSAHIGGAEEENHPPVDVLKAAHHGSKTSTSPAWLAYWNPADVVVSVGRNNTYGHPHPTVVARIESFGSSLYRTDLDGEIQYRVEPGGALSRREKRAGARFPGPS